MAEAAEIIEGHPGRHYQKLADGRAVKEETTAGPASGAAKIMSA